MFKRSGLKIHVNNAAGKHAVCEQLATNLLQQGAFATAPHSRQHLDDIFIYEWPDEAQVVCALYHGYSSLLVITDIL
jgi:hypothetical protein